MPSRTMARPTVCSRLVVTAMLTVLAACGGPPLPPPAPPAVAVPEPAPQVAVPAPLPPPVIPRFDTGPDAPPPNPRGLIGVEDRAVQALLGDPTVRRREVAAQLWVYRGGPCVLQLFFYAEGSPERYFARHVEMRPAARSTISPEQCFLRLLRRETTVER